MAANRTSTATKTKKKSKPPPIQNESTHQQTPQKNQPNSSSSTPKRTKSPGVRVIGCRIYDSKNGNLVIRYGENAEEAAASGDWKCPRCRGICNCSFCMKKRGCGPTGVLIHTAKKNGYASVSNLLNMKGSSGTKVVNCGAKKKRTASDKETGDELARKLMKDGGGCFQFCKEETNTIEDTSEDQNVELQLPQGTELANLVGIDLPLGDIGHALQLLEFCETFGEVLQLKRKEFVFLLTELTCANGLKTHESVIVQFHIRLISLIEQDLGKKYSENSWIEAFKECIFDTQYPSKELLLELFNMQPNGYDELNFSKKLRLLNFLCDEALGTVKLRLWIEERNVEEKKKAKERLMANRDKKKNIKKKVQDEVAKAILSRNGFPLTISEQKDLVSKVKAETAQTLANSLEMREVSHRESYVVRSEPILSDINGCKLWKLRCLHDKIGILLQDSCYGDVITSDEKWFSYNDQEKALVNEYISNSRIRKNDGNDIGTLDLKIEDLGPNQTLAEAQIAYESVSKCVFGFYYVFS
ncbi:hypothetical protein R6Q57_022923 [Mikania cordata]